MTTAQPGQEQRMELKAGTYLTAHWEGSDEAQAWLHMGRGLVEQGVLGYTRDGDWHHVIAPNALSGALSGARPTADLGEDGELVDRARQSADGFRKFLQERSTADLLDALADRLILYREARAGLADEIAAAMQKERDTIGATEQQRIAFGYAEAAMRAVLSRSGG